ncbi:hypothetical protein E3N85_06280 [Cryobacterium sp. Hz9]|nr:hypothetical protein E3N85_06280 [Cryobacterium sp. Hz9]
MVQRFQLAYPRRALLPSGGYPRYLVRNLRWCEYLRVLACRVRHDCCPQSLMIRGVLSPDPIGVG